MEITVITEEAHSVAAEVVDGRMLVEAGCLPDAVGWELKPEGLCQGDTCVPERDVAALHFDGRLDLAKVAGALGRAVVVDAGAGLVALALSSEQRRQAVDGLQAPAFTLADLDGTDHDLAEWRGQKKLLVAFSTW